MALLLQPFILSREAGIGDAMYLDMLSEVQNPPIADPTSITRRVEELCHFVQEINWTLYNPCPWLEIEEHFIWSERLTETVRSKFEHLFTPFERYKVTEDLGGWLKSSKRSELVTSFNLS